jgi:hypothetical protein
MAFCTGRQPRKNVKWDDYKHLPVKIEMPNGAATFKHDTAQWMLPNEPVSPKQINVQTDSDELIRLREENQRLRSELA